MGRPSAGPLLAASSLEHRRERTSAAIERDPASLRERFQRPAPAVLAQTGSLDAAERHVRLVVHGRAVHVAIAGVQLVDDRKRPRLVLREHTTRQTVLSIVGDLDRLLVRAERDYRND